MLPPGTVHLKDRPGIGRAGGGGRIFSFQMNFKFILARVAKQQKIFAPDAIVDFMYRGGRMVPIKVYCT